MSILRQPPRAGIGRESQDAQSMLCSKHSHGMPCSSNRWATHRHPHNSFWQRSWCQKIFPDLVSRILDKPLCCFQLGFGSGRRTPTPAAGGPQGGGHGATEGPGLCWSTAHHFLTPEWALFSFLGMAGPTSSEDTCLPAFHGELEELGDLAYQQFAESCLSCCGIF